MLSISQMIFIITMIALVPVVVVVIASLFVRKAMNELHTSLNGRLTQLMEVSRAAARLEGVREGEHGERERQERVEDKRAEDKRAEERAEERAEDKRAQDKRRTP